MNQDLKYFNVGSNTNLKAKYWIDKNINNYKGIVIIVHGMGEHIDRYDEFATILKENGYIVYGYNQRGHKDSIKTKEDYGFISDFDGFNLLVNDLHTIFRTIKNFYPNLPIYMFGHSMGSFVQQRFAQLYSNEIDGLILSGTGKNSNLILKFGELITKTSIKFYGIRHRSSFVDKLVFGKYNKKFKPNRTKLDWLNRNNLEVDKYIIDSYCGGKFTNAYYRDFFSSLIEINKNQSKIDKDLPILMISGEMDPVGNYSKSVISLYETYKKNGIKNIELKLYKDARHEIILENCKKEVYNDVISWLNKQEKCEINEKLS